MNDTIKQCGNSPAELVSLQLLAALKEARAIIGTISENASSRSDRAYASRMLREGNTIDQAITAAETVQLKEDACAASRRPVAPEAIELLQIWKTWLGSSRSQCDEHGKRLWDRIESVVSSQPEVSVTTTDGTIPLGTTELNALRAAHEPFRGMGAPAGVDADELLALLDTIDALQAKLQATNARMADQERRLTSCCPHASLLPTPFSVAPHTNTMARPQMK